MICDRILSHPFPPLPPGTLQCLPFSPAEIFLGEKIPEFNDCAYRIDYWRVGNCLLISALTFCMARSFFTRHKMITRGTRTRKVILLFGSTKLRASTKAARPIFWNMIKLNVKLSLETNKTQIPKTYWNHLIKKGQVDLKLFIYLYKKSQ